MDGLYSKYFVLKPRGDDAYAAASRAAMFRYALFIVKENPELAKEVWDWAGNELMNARYPDEERPPKHWRPEGARPIEDPTP